MTPKKHRAKTSIHFYKGLVWIKEQGEKSRGPLLYRAERKDDLGRIISFATVTTRLGGMLKMHKAEVTILNNLGLTATSMERIFEGRGGQFPARKWAEIMLFYPPAKVITHVEL